MAQKIIVIERDDVICGTVLVSPPPPEPTPAVEADTEQENQ